MPDFDVVDLPDIDHVEEGETAPDFTRPLVNDEYWENRSLDELTSEGRVLLVFHPMDGAFPTTYIYQNFAERGFDADVDIVGVSVSSPYEHKTLLEEREGVEFRAFSDPSNEVAEAYGIDHDLDGMAGVSEPRPAVFLLDEGRDVEYAWVAEEWPSFPDYDAVEAAIR
ncbi:redoxin domain-containing protein [Halocalculus aciditolerans]|uniref:Peroxiredoxin n=1 Tax=Halocalculus aciditolerans TaxID=1383812 RepID=A0A830FHF4_9EURY|nr:peroxiredoxin [Halocalculus aciditolerans]